MKKNNTIKLIEGGLIGAALGIAAGIILAPESGKKFRNDVKNKSAEFHAYLAPRFKKMKRVGEKEYDLLINKAAKSYTKTKSLSEKEGRALIAEAKKSWEYIKKQAV
ncbi:MAG: YtxH domain-containing protein [Minisyncoccota bacterium]